MNCERANLLSVQVPSNDVNSAGEHAEVLRTRSVLRESREREEDPERALVTVDAKKRVLLLIASGLQHVVRRVFEKVAVDRWRPRKYLQYRRSLDVLILTRFYVML